MLRLNVRRVMILGILCLTLLSGCVADTSADVHVRTDDSWTFTLDLGIDKSSDSGMGTFLGQLAEKEKTNYGEGVNVTTSRRVEGNTVHYALLYTGTKLESLNAVLGSSGTGGNLVSLPNNQIRLQIPQYNGDMGNFDLKVHGSNILANNATEIIDGGKTAHWTGADMKARGILFAEVTIVPEPPAAAFSWTWVGGMTSMALLLPFLLLVLLVGMGMKFGTIKKPLPWQNPEAVLANKAEDQNNGEMTTI